MIIAPVRRRRREPAGVQRYDGNLLNSRNVGTDSPPSSDLSLGQVNEDQLTAQICKASFFEFVKEFWNVFVHRELILNWHIKFICDEAQKLAERVFAGLPKEHDFIVNVPPGTSKSSLLSISFLPWCWTRDPTMKAICGSNADELALEFSIKTRDIVLSDKYKQLFPGIELREDQNTKGHFANTKGGARYALGVGTNVIGKHAHFLIIDDPIDPMKAVSDLEIKSVNRWMAEQLSQRKVEKSITPLMLIMQRLHQDDPTGHILARGTKVKHICLPASISHETVRALVQPPEVAKNYIDNLLDPIRLPQEVLDNAFKELGQFGHACQFDQNPIPVGGGMFQTDRLNLKPVVQAKMKFVVRYWDKAVSTKKDACFTVGAKMGQDVDGHFWILDMIRGRWGTSDRERLIVATARLDGKDVTIGLEQEGGSGGLESCEQTVRRLAGFRVRTNKPTQNQDKASRADPFSVQVNAGNVYCLERPWLQDLLAEMRYFPHSRYFDQLDGLSGAFSLLAKPRVRIGAL